MGLSVETMNYFVVRHGGKVGIGTTDPTHTFYVKTSDAAGLFEF